MRLTLFSLEDANRTVTEIRPLLERLCRARREFDVLGDRLGVLWLAVAGASPSNPDQAEVRRVQARRSVLADEMTRGLQVIQQRGCVVKDLDKGMVDFYALAGDRLIFLCWQLGEAEVSHWHTLEDGYAGRQPLDRLELD